MIYLITFKNKLVFLIVDLLHWDKIKSIDIGDIIKAIAHDIIRKINRKPGRIVYDEQQFKKIIKRIIFLYYYQRRIFKRYGMIIKDEPITKEQKLVLNDLFMIWILYQLIITHSNDSTFYDKIYTFFKSIGITNCEWINKTYHEEYFCNYIEIASKIYKDKEKLKLVDYLKEKEIPIFKEFWEYQSIIFFKIIHVLMILWLKNI